ncbi:hypothetical protein SEA_KEELAN_128 [Gordonia phage Keelan]|nr:hypothetical protein SEA_KEELAN_128 [Gordonia phage Keelan]
MGNLKGIGYVQVSQSEVKNDPVSHPAHYSSHGIECESCGAPIECITVASRFSFNLGNTIKYVWRADHKGKLLEDLKKARQYLDFEIAKLTKELNG